MGCTTLTKRFLSIWVLAIVMTSCGADAKQSSAKVEIEKGGDTEEGNLNEAQAAATVEVLIGTQTWMKENLSVTRFRNGDPIPEAQTAKEWADASNAKQPAWCWYEGDGGKFGKKYGVMYNWYAVNHPSGLAPEGWRVAEDEDWSQLEKFLGGNIGAAVVLKNESGWFQGGNGSNSKGFSALPGGMRLSLGMFSDVERIGSWWTATEENEDRAWERSMGYGNKDVYRSYGYKGAGYSVRCVKE
jgi:uncharacterized protein (TIGR02145 family)